MRPRMTFALAVLVSLPAEAVQAGDGFLPWFSRKPSAGNTSSSGEDTVPAADTPPQASSSQGQVVQSGYSVPQSSSANCAPQYLPGGNRACPPRECPPEVCPPPFAQPQNAPIPYVQPQAAPGMFAAPQGRGEISGESRSVGIRGFAIRFPAIQIEFPTIQLPSLICFRREPEMRLESAYAPYVAGVPAVYGQLAPGGIAQMAPVAPPAPPPPAYVQPQAAPAHRQPCPPPFSAPTSQADCAEQDLRHELAERERTIRELESKLQKFQALEQNLNELSKQQQQLRDELRRPGCAPEAGRAESASPPIEAPAPSAPPFAPPSTEESKKGFFKVFD